MASSNLFESDEHFDLIQAGVLPGATIPQHIDASIPLIIATSKSQNSRKGVFVSNKVRKGAQILTISTPLINIAGDGIDLMRGTCDYCFAKPSSQAQLSVCGQCSIVSFCNKECQQAAWQHHHKIECETLKKVKTSGQDDGAFAQSGFRCLVRLLLLHAAGKIEDSEWLEFKSFNVPHTQWTDFNLREHIEELVASVIKYVETKLTNDQLTRIAYAMYDNMLGTELPLRKVQTMKNPATKVKGGWCLDLFLSMIQHSTSANVKWVFSGKEVTVLATKDIEASEELLFFG